MSEKRRFQPSQRAPFLGFIWDLSVSYMDVTQKRLDKLCALLADAMHKLDGLIRARDLARIAGSIISMGPAFGSIARLISRTIYHAINCVSHLDNIVDLKTQRDVCDEIQFWFD